MTIAAYYNGFRSRLLEDYEIRNRRVVAALEFAKESLSDAGSVLDVGCGVGWTSSEIADVGHNVTGLDISPVLIETAREMFESDRCTFLVGDFAATELPQADAVVMIDVYEHFPRELHPVVHRQIRETGCEMVALTIPTPETQQRARDAGIELQPIDEDITDADIDRLAEDIGGVVTVNRRVSIWADNDYRHVLIQR